MKPHWDLDEHLYPILDGLDEHPVFVWAKRRDFPAEVRFSKFNKMLTWRFGFTAKWRCFISGVQCHYAPLDTTRDHQRRLPWQLSMDHLVPMGIGEGRARRIHDRRMHTMANHAIVGRRLNSRQLGHMPLPLKILHRQRLARLSYDREDVSGETNYPIIRQAIIDGDDALRMHGRYPWQPWTYEVSEHRRAATAFMDAMTACEDEFLSLPRNHERLEWIEGLRWSW